MTLPVVQVKVPASIASLTPAQIEAQREKILTRVFFLGVGYSWLHPAAARAWAAMCIAVYAQFQAWLLTAVSTADVLRRYSTQVNAFNTRYTETWSLQVNGLTNRVANTRTWNGTPGNTGPGVMKKYYLRKGAIPCAVPGKGWHPRALAIDVAVYDPSLNDGNQYPGGARYIRSNPALFTWLKANVTSFGFSWENEKEYVDDPHLRYTAGDVIPKRVLDIEAFLAAQGGK